MILNIMIENTSIYGRFLIDNKLIVPKPNIPYQDYFGDWWVLHNDETIKVSDKRWINFCKKQNLMKLQKKRF